MILNMHKVERNQAPDGLVKLSEEFKKNYNDSTNMTDEWTNFSKSKLKKEVVDSLNEMYSGMCAYCEASISEVAFPNIEHFRPKSVFPLLCYEYSNKHCVCPSCNTNKKDKFDEKMIDPSVDNPEKHIKFEGYTAVAKDERGQMMIELLKINNEKRTHEKKDLFEKYTKAIEAVETFLLLKNKVSDEDWRLCKEASERLLLPIENNSCHGKQYCTMCKHNFLEYVKKLKKEL